MNKKASIEAFVIIALTLFILFLSFSWYFPMETEPDIIRLSCPTPVCNPPPVSCGTPNITVQDVTLTTKVYTSHFQEIITGCYEEKPYKKGGWDCDRISNECSSRLQNAGYPCHTQVGYYYEEDGTRTNHAWVECGNNDEYLIIESTTGQIVPPWEWERYKAK